jgi:hypothetical protein
MFRSCSKVAVAIFALSSSHAVPSDCSAISSINFEIQEWNLKTQWLATQIEVAKAQQRLMERDELMRTVIEICRLSALTKNGLEEMVKVINEDPQRCDVPVVDFNRLQAYASRPLIEYCQRILGTAQLNR